MGEKCFLQKRRKSQNKGIRLKSALQIVFCRDVTCMQYEIHEIHYFCEGEKGQNMKKIFCSVFLLNVEV